jgi:hypothetical protein
VVACLSPGSRAMRDEPGRGSSRPGRHCFYFFFDDLAMIGVPAVCVAMLVWLQVEVSLPAAVQP